MADESGKPGNDSKPFDPMEPWRGMRDAYLDVWSKSMVEMVNTEAYAQATGAILDSYLTVSAPFREAVEKAMLKTLEQLAMPTRADVISIAERMTNIEMRLDDLDAKIDTILRATASVTTKTRTEAGPATGKRAPQQASKAVRSSRPARGKK